MNKFKMYLECLINTIKEDVSNENSYRKVTKINTTDVLLQRNFNEQSKVKISKRVRRTIIKIVNSLTPGDNFNMKRDKIYYHFSYIFGLIGYKIKLVSKKVSGR